MQLAKCLTDNHIWDAVEFAALPDSQLDVLRRNLSCTECAEFAWFRKASRHGHPAHFCAHHLESCSLKIGHTTVDDSDADKGDDLNTGHDIVVNLENEKGGSIDVQKPSLNPQVGPYDEQKRYIIVGSRPGFSQNLSLRRILYKLVQSPDFRESKKSIVFLKGNNDVLVEGMLKDVISSFDMVTESHNEKFQFYWGAIASAKKSTDGKLWLNSASRYQAISIVLFEDMVDDFLNIFEIEDIEDLAGAHVLVAGRCKIGSKKKPIIWCGTSKYLAVRKYKTIQADF